MIRTTVIPVFLILIAAGIATADDPVVSGVSISQRTDGSGLVDIHYDLEDAEGDSVYVSFRASDDGGQTWLMPIYSLSGDAGPGIPSTTGRNAVWDLRTDHPDINLDDCRVTVLASDQGVGHEAHSPNKYCVLHFGGAPFWDPGFIEKIARADLLVLTAGVLWDDGNHERYGITDQIHALNPDCKIIGYASAKTVRLDWEGLSPDSYNGRLWNDLLPYWCYTTEGDTLQDYPAAVVVNILDPACRKVIIDSFVDFQSNSNNNLDGIYWDYFNNGIWIPDALDVEGSADMDGDGIPQQNDPDELAAYKTACEDLVLEMRDRLGEDFIQIFNGQRAYADSSFASLSDGFIYELFPGLFFPGTEEMRTALDPKYEYNVFRTSTWPRTRNGGPYVIVQTKQVDYYFPEDGPRLLPTGNFFRAVSLLTDIYPVWHHDGLITYGWPINPLTLGEPLGPTVIDGDLYTRQFRYGDIELVMESGSMPVPFRYVIRCDGQVVEMLDFPTTVYPPGIPY